MDILNEKLMLWDAILVATIWFALHTDISTSSKPSPSGIDVISAEVISRMSDQISPMATSNLQLQLICPLTLKLLPGLVMNQNKQLHCPANTNDKRIPWLLPSPTSKSLKASSEPESSSRISPFRVNIMVCSFMSTMQPTTSPACQERP